MKRGCPIYDVYDEHFIKQRQVDTGTYRNRVTAIGPIGPKLFSRAWLQEASQTDFPEKP
jgi:hypothetical protein